MSTPPECHHSALILVSSTTTKPAGKVTREAKAVAIGESPVRVLADASEITGLPRDNFEVWEIAKEEYEGFRSR
jgi:hypothetical protein